MISLSDYPSPRNIKVVFFDFDGVFTDNRVLLDENGVEYVSCSRYDGFGLSAISSMGIYCHVISSEVKPLALRRCEKLNIPCSIGIKDKPNEARRILNSLSLDFSSSAFLGNDINDLQLLRLVSLPVVTPDAHSSVLLDSFYVTSKSGGFGCVRELCDFLSS